MQIGAINSFYNSNGLNKVSNITFSAVQTRSKKTQEVGDSVQISSNPVDKLMTDTKEFLLSHDNFGAILGAYNRTNFDLQSQIELGELKNIFKTLQKNKVVDLAGAKIIARGNESLVYELQNGKVLKISQNIPSEIALNIMKDETHPLHDNVLKIDSIQAFEGKGGNYICAIIQEKVDTKITNGEYKKVLKKFEAANCKFYDIDENGNNATSKRQFGKDKAGNIVLVDYGTLQKQMYQNFAIRETDSFYVPNLNGAKLFKMSSQDSYDIDFVKEAFEKRGKRVKSQEVGDVKRVYQNEYGEKYIELVENGKNCTLLFKIENVFGEVSKIVHEFKEGKLVRKTTYHPDFTILFEPLDNIATIKFKDKIYIVEKKQNKEPKILDTLRPFDVNYARVLDYLNSAID